MLPTTKDQSAAFSGNGEKEEDVCLTPSDMLDILIDRILQTETALDRPIYPSSDIPTSDIGGPTLTFEGPSTSFHVTSL